MPILFYPLLFLFILSHFTTGQKIINISNCAELQAINEDVDLSNTYILTNDIECSHDHYFIPIAYHRTFKGIFDGNNFTIRNVRISVNASNSHIGLFSNAQGQGVEIKNVKLENVGVKTVVNPTYQVFAGILIGQIMEITISNVHIISGSAAGYNVGGLIGYVGFSSDYKTMANITNCSVSSNVTLKNLAPDTSLGGCAGGLIGAVYDAVITNCSAHCNIDSGTYYMGGLIGFSGGEIYNSYATGDVSPDKTFYRYLGGLAGVAMYGTIKNSYATGAVYATAQNSSSYDYVHGGLIARCDGVIVENCYATGKVTAKYGTLGGLIGALITTSSNYPAQIINSYSIGKVQSGNDNTNKDYTNVYDQKTVSGGLIGDSYSAFPELLGVTNSYWNIETSGQTNSGGPIGSYGKTTQEMYSQETYIGWDFNNTWGIEEGENYPFLLIFLNSSET